MPLFQIEAPLVFPHPVLREPEGIMAIGGDLSPGRLLLAYSWGIFPWYQAGEPIMWWWLCPRLMIRPHEVHVSHSVRNFINRNKYRVTFNQDFSGVIRQCAVVNRRGQDSTWITGEMIEAYTTLHHLGHAYSAEVYEEDQLVGGVYGVAIGRIFVGESMFALKPNASKVCFVTLAAKLASLGFDWIDCEQDTPHMRTFGGALVEEEAFLEILRQNHRKTKPPFA